MVPSAVPLTASRMSMMVPPAPAKKADLAAKSTASSASGSKTSKAAPKNAFTLLMKKSFEDRAKIDAEKAKAGNKTMKAMPAPPIVFTPVGKSKDANGAASSQPKKRLKERMRRREKRPADAPFTIALPCDDDDEELHDETGSESRVDGGTNHVDIAGPSMNAEAENEVTPGALAVVETFVAPEIVDNELPREDEGVPKIDDNIGETPEATETTHVDDRPLPHQADGGLAQASSTSAPADSTDADVPTGETNEPQPEQDEVPQMTEPRPLSRAGKNKAPLGKKRQAPSIPVPVRVTRSSSTKKNMEAQGSKIRTYSLDVILLMSILMRLDITAGPSSKKLLNPRPPPATNKRVASGSLRKRASPAASAGDVEDEAMAVDEAKEKSLYTGSPMRISPVKSSPRVSRSEKDEGQSMVVDTDVLSVNSTPTKSHQPPSPSPTKIARSTFFAMKLAGNFSAHCITLFTDSYLSWQCCTHILLELPSYRA